VYLLFIKRDTENIPTPNEQTATTNSRTVTNIETSTIDEVLAQYGDDKAGAFAVLSSNGFTNMNFSRYDEAISYFKAASEIAPNQETKDDIDLNIYYTAKKANNTAVISEYEALLGEKITQPAVRPRDEINGQ